MKTTLSIVATMLGISFTLAQATEKTNDYSVTKNSNTSEKIEVTGNMKTTNLQFTTAAENEGTSFNPLVAEPVNLLVVDLSVQDRVTVTATTGLSAGTVSGATFDGFYLKDFFSTAGTVTVPVSPGYSGTPTFTAASVATNNIPRMYRAGSGTDPGLNIYGYSGATTTTFTNGQLAFTGSVTWTVTTAVYNAMLTAPAAGDVYFVADSVGMLSTATLIGKYTVVKTNLAVSDAKKNTIAVYPNPFRDVLNISDVQNVKSVSVHDISGRLVKTLVPSTDLNLSTLKEGVYIINLLMKDGSIQSSKQIKK